MVSHTFKGPRRTSYPSGPWVDERGNPCESPNKVYERNYSPPPSPTIVDPSPTNWKILEAHEELGWLVVRLKYEGCTNYEGEKILVYKNMTLVKLVNNKAIDPHFLVSGVSPTARFVPTHEGWKMALSFIRNYK